MKFMRGILLLLIAVSPSLHSQNGLLLGLRNNSVPRGYSTLWIRPTDHGVVFRKFDGLIVPRNDGFWRVGKAYSCDLDNPDHADVEVSKSDNQVAINDRVTENTVVWFAKEGEMPLARGGDCAEIENLASALVERARKEYLTGQRTLSPASFEDRVCAYSSEELHFINGRYMAIAQADGQECWSVVNNRSWMVTGFYSSQRQDVSMVLDKAGVAKFVQLAKDNVEEEACAPGDDVDTSNWLIYHEHGRWRMKGGFFSTVIYCHGSGSEFEIDATPPATIVGREQPVSDWKGLAGAVAGAQDAVISLDKQWMAVVGAFPCKSDCDPGSAVRVYAIENGKPTRLLGETRIGVGAEIVMQEWSLGVNVAKWDQALQNVPSALPAVRYHATEAMRGVGR